VRILRISSDALVPITVFLILFIPKTQDVIAKLLSIDRLNHFDTFLGAPGWAAFSGLKLNVDIFSQYGLGMPIILSRMVGLLGRFDHANILTVFVGIAIVYYIIYYIFLRVWLRSIVLALIGLMLAMKIHMFSPDATEYLIWKHPSTSVVRYFFDGLFFLLLVFHNRNIEKKIYLFGIALLNGIALFYILDTGIYLLITAYAYLVMTLIVPAYREKMYKQIKDYALLIVYVLLPLVLDFLLTLSYAGKAALSSGFWLNMKEYVDLAMGGFDGLPIYWGLGEGLFSSFFFGVVILLTYLVTISVWGSLLLLR